MKKTITLSSMLFLATGYTSASQPIDFSNINEHFKRYPTAAGAAHGVHWVEGQIIVKPKAGVSKEKLERILQRSNGRSKARMQKIGVHVVEVPEQAEDAVIKALRNNPNIEYAERDQLVALSASAPNDAYYYLQWHLPKIGALTAWDDTAGAGVTVAILDTGVESDHPDLAANMVPGWNSASNNSDTSPVHWHGTGVAGTVAAISNNGMGMSSVAWDANIMPIRVTDRSDGVATSSAIANGIIWAADNGADVINMSYDINISVDNVVKDAAQYLRGLGGVAVAAAGNSSMDYGYADNPYIINVSATTSSDVKAGFSNYGSIVDVAAPGEDIYTLQTNGGYAVALGTSFASPATAGVVALIMSANPYLTPEEVEDVLEQSADDLVAGSNVHPYYGHGRVNAAAAVALAKSYSSVDSQAPVVSILSPQHNATTSGDVLIEISATDNVGVSQVDLFIDSELIGSDLTAPYLFSWDSTQTMDGSVSVVAKAQDTAGNEGSSSAFSLIVDNLPEEEDTTPPSVNIFNPAGGSTVSRTVNISVTAQDNVGIAHMNLLVDDATLCSNVGVETLSCSWNTRKASSGSHQITAIVEDTAGNVVNQVVTVYVATSDTTTKGRGKKK